GRDGDRPGLPDLALLRHARRRDPHRLCRLDPPPGRDCPRPGPTRHRSVADMKTHESENSDFELLLEYLRRSRGFDFTGYKRSSLMRRVNKRMHAVDVQEYASYVDFLEVHPEEFGHLFDTILINVTAFFRDPSAWEIIKVQVVPRILASKRSGEPI